MFKEGVLASLFWAANIVLVKVFLNSEAPQTLAFYKALLSSLFLWIFIKEKIKLSMKEFFYCVLVGFFSVYLNYFFSYQGIKEVSLAEVSLMNASSLVFMRTSFDRFCFLILVGVFIGLNGQINFYLLSSMISFIIGMRLARKSKLNPLSRTTITLFLGSLFFLPNLTAVSFSMMQWLLFLLISVIGYGYIMFIYQKTSAYNPYLNLHPIFTYLLGISLFNEPVVINQVVAFLLVFIAIFLEKKIKKQS